MLIVPASVSPNKFEPLETNRVITRAKKLLGGEGLRAQLLRGGIGSLLTKAGGAGLAFLVAVTLARVLGPDGYGVYSFALAVIMLTAIPAQVGVPQLIVRETARAQANGNYARMRGLWRWGNLSVIMLSALALAVVSCTIWFTNSDEESARVITLAVGIALIPIIALANVRSACLRGLRKVVKGQLPESIVRPAILVFLVFAWGTWLDEGELGPQVAMGLYVVAAISAFVVGAWLLQRSLPIELSEQSAPEYQSSAWRKAVIPLAMISGLQLINNYADLIIMGIFRSDQEVGIYRAVFQLSLLVSFGLQAMNQMLQPHFASLYVNQDKEKLQRLVTNSARAILILSLPPAIAFILFGNKILEWIFGEPFGAGGLALSILVVGQLVNAGIGSVGALLAMTGHERDSLRGIASASATNICLNLILIPKLGIVGAALATAGSIITWNLILRRYVKKRLSIEASALGYTVRKKPQSK